MSLAVSGFAHKSASAPMNADLQAYLEMGGTLDDICGAFGQPGMATPKCEACRLADTVMAPILQARTMPGTSPVIRQMRHVAQLRHHAKPLDPSQQTRAPPQA